MRLNLRLLKALLAHCESQTKRGPYEIPESILSLYDDPEVSYHIYLCEYEGYLTQDDGLAFIGELTMKGHEKLAQLREDLAMDPLRTLPK